MDVFFVDNQRTHSPPPISPHHQKNWKRLHTNVFFKQKLHNSIGNQFITILKFTNLETNLQIYYKVTNLLQNYKFTTKLQIYYKVTNLQQSYKFTTKLQITYYN
jgi:hypothetical protein